ncbi:MAG TPA: DUF2891 domain-containing protein [Streptosporangiaceae bacterium]|jgi:hypothetical protein
MANVRFVQEWNVILQQNAAAYAQVAITNIGLEFPVGSYYVMNEPDDLPGRPRDLTPVFYGSFDWHSCVEMHWLLVRLLRTVPEFVPVAEIKATLDAQFTAEKLATEAAYMAGPGGFGERPYGWGWALTMVHEVELLASELAGRQPDGSQAALGESAQQWLSALEPLGAALTGCFLEWLPKATYPVRYGVHQNSAFGLGRALPYARERMAAGDGRLAEAIRAAARRWFATDRDYPAGWEPSGSDFLSAALIEAELMTLLLPADQLSTWLTGFLPGIVSGEPSSIFNPALVSDSADGHIAHLHGLNASRAWCWRRLAESLPPGDARIEPALAAAWRHAEAALPHVVGSHYMVEHWLAAYAVLLLS